MEIFHANNSAVHPIDVGLAGPADGLLGEVANIGKKIKGVGPHAQQLLHREADEVEDFISSVSTTVSAKPNAVMTKAQAAMSGIVGQQSRNLPNSMLAQINTNNNANIAKTGKVTNIAVSSVIDSAQDFLQDSAVPYSIGKVGNMRTGAAGIANGLLKSVHEYVDEGMDMGSSVLSSSLKSSSQQPSSPHRFGGINRQSPVSSTGPFETASTKGKSVNITKAPNRKTLSHGEFTGIDPHSGSEISKGPSCRFVYVSDGWDPDTEDDYLPSLFNALRIPVPSVSFVTSRCTHLLPQAGLKLSNANQTTNTTATTNSSGGGNSGTAAASGGGNDTTIPRPVPNIIIPSNNSGEQMEVIEQDATDEEKRFFEIIMKSRMSTIMKAISTACVQCDGMYRIHTLTIDLTH